MSRSIHCAVGWLQRKKHSGFKNFIAPLPAELWAPLAVCYQIANSRKRWRCYFKVLSQDEGRADFSKNLCALLFNDDLSNVPNLRPDPSRRTVPLKYLLRWVKNSINRIVRMNCIVGKFPFPVLIGHHHERIINQRLDTFCLRIKMMSRKLNHAMGRGIDSRNRVWNWLAKLHRLVGLKGKLHADFTLKSFFLYSIALHLFVGVQVVPAVDAMAGDISEPEEEEGSSSATSSSASIELDRAVPRHTLLGMPQSSVHNFSPWPAQQSLEVLHRSPRRVYLFHFQFFFYWTSFFFLVISTTLVWIRIWILQKFWIRIRISPKFGIRAQN